MSAGRNSISLKKDWNTPPKYVQLISKFFDGNIDLDPCSNSGSLVEASIKYILPQDGLKEPWDYNTIFINPPYGRDKQRRTSIYNWISKSVDSYLKNKNHILLLIPVATNTRHFKELIFKHASNICFLEDTRLKFWSDGKEDKKGAPMACCIVYFGCKNNFEEIFGNYGKCFKI